MFMILWLQMNCEVQLRPLLLGNWLVVEFSWPKKKKKTKNLMWCSDAMNTAVWKQNSLTTVGPSSVIGADVLFHLLKHFIHQWPNPCPPALVHMAGSYADARMLYNFSCTGHSWHISLWTGCSVPKEYRKYVGIVKPSARLYIIYPFVPHTGPWWSIAHGFHQTLSALIHL